MGSAGQHKAFGPHLAALAPCRVSYKVKEASAILSGLLKALEPSLGSRNALSAGQSLVWHLCVDSACVEGLHSQGQYIRAVVACEVSNSASGTSMANSEAETLHSLMLSSRNAK